MITFSAGDLVKAPFRHVERDVYVVRPTVVISRGGIGPHRSLLWVAMVTNLAHEDWPGDLPIPDSLARGLLIPSKIRTVKLATVEERAASRIGQIGESLWQALHVRLVDQLGAFNPAAAR